MSPEAGRVISGIAKGTRLLAPGEGTRPLSDRVKQALFGTLTSELADTWPVDVLDLFAGSGAAGIEALSRGAERAVFVERDAGAARVIAENLKRARLTGGTVVRRDVVAFLASGTSDDVEERRFGAVIVDPPYGEAATLHDALVRVGDPQLRWLRDDAVVVAKHFWRDAPPVRIGDLMSYRSSRFGETALTFYRVEAVGDREPTGGDGPDDRHEPTR